MENYYENNFDRDILEQSYEKKERTNNNKPLQGRHFAGIIIFLAMIGSLCVGMVMTNVASAQIRCEISKLNRDIVSVEGEIQNLSVAIEQQNKSDIIEDAAIQMLGMQYPVNEQIIYLNTEVKSDGNFAMLLKGHKNN